MTPWTAAQQASLSFPISQSLLKLMSIESVMPSNHLILCCPLLLLSSVFPSIRVFSSELALPIRWPKCWSFSFSIPVNIQDWFPLGLIGLISLLYKGLLRVFSSTIGWNHQFFWCSTFFVIQLSHLYMTTGKIIALIICIFFGKVISLLFNTLCRLVIDFFPRSKCLLFSWLWSTCIVILEPKKMKSPIISIFSHLFVIKWWDWMPWSLYFECWVLSQLFYFHLHQEAL